VITSKDFVNDWSWMTVLWFEMHDILTLFKNFVLNCRSCWFWFCSLVSYLFSIDFCILKMIKRKSSILFILLNIGLYIFFVYEETFSNLDLLMLHKKSNVWLVILEETSWKNWLLWNSMVVEFHVCLAWN
jgi:hypothetical protein